ncbi:hypothetical protein [Limnohabitans sp.]|uniref:hypothetical protein n=1 Tax=Limnohabitans sp. TaxID=1907725 RepID=UPI0025BC3859|nr:hypothetical protein [Limnohabitans sp.]
MWNRQAHQDPLPPALAQQWVLTSRCLSKLSGFMQASALSDVEIQVLLFAEALDTNRASGSQLDAATLARCAVTRESARPPEAREALRGLMALQLLNEKSDESLLTVTDLVELQTLLDFGRADLNPSLKFELLECWVDDWQQASQLEAFADPLLQWPALNARWRLMKAMSGNGERLGRVLDVLLLKRADLLPSMGLLWSRALRASKQAHHSPLMPWEPTQADVQAWQMQMLKTLASAAGSTLDFLVSLSTLWGQVQHDLQAQHRFYSRELLVHLFVHPATRVELLARDLAVTRLTATRYLEALVATGILQRERHGRDNIYSHNVLLAMMD